MNTFLIVDWRNHLGRYGLDPPTIARRRTLTQMLRELESVELNIRYQIGKTYNNAYRDGQMGVPDTEAMREGEKRIQDGLVSIRELREKIKKHLLDIDSHTSL